MIVISPAGPDDALAVAQLLTDLDAFYGAPAPQPAAERVTAVEQLLFRPQPAAHVLLARDADQAVGLASYSFLWPAAGVTQSLYLKELYVTHAHRGQGVGRELMAHLRDVAATAGCSRMEWTTDTDNPDASRFYEKLGFAAKSTKIFFRAEL